MSKVICVTRLSKQRVSLGATRRAMLDLAPGANHIFRQQGGVAFYGYAYFHNSPYHNQICPVLGVDLNDATRLWNIYGYQLKAMTNWGNTQYILISNWPLNLIEVLGIVVGVHKSRPSGEDMIVLLDDSSGSYIKCWIPISVYKKLDLDAEWDKNYGRFLQVKGRVFSEFLGATRSTRVDAMEMSPLVAGPGAFSRQYSSWRQALTFRQQLLATPWDFTPVGRSPGCAFDGGHDYNEIRTQLPRSDDSVCLSKMNQRRHTPNGRISSSQPALSRTPSRAVASQNRNGINGYASPSPTPCTNGATTDLSTRTTLPVVMTTICEVMADNKFEPMTLGLLFTSDVVATAIKNYTNFLRRGQQVNNLKELTYKSVFKQVCRRLVETGVMVRNDDTSDGSNRTWFDPSPLRLVYAVILRQLRQNLLVTGEIVDFLHTSGLSITVPLFDSLVEAVIKRFGLGQWQCRMGQWQLILST